MRDKAGHKGRIRPNLREIHLLPALNRRLIVLIDKVGHF
ncbi:hypothetical protein FOFC_14182 [Fusarium oxysporum]|nr:hypothetical protein FOFC_14182 [Fusarium oxysporum]